MHDLDERNGYVPDSAVTAVLVVTSCISLLCLVPVLVCPCMYRRLLRHPSPLLSARAAFDFIFTCVSLASHLSAVGGDRSPSTAECETMAFITQVAAAAAELYICLLSWDLLTSIRNPFTSHKSAMRWYHAIAITIALVSATLLIGLQAGSYPLYGRDNYLSLCWIRMENEAGQLDASVVMFVVVPLLLLYICCFAVLLYAANRLRHGLPETFDARLSVFRSSIRIVLCYTLYWLVVLAVYAIVEMVYSNEQADPLALLISIAIGSRGIVTFWTWTLTFGRSVWRWRRNGCFIPRDTSDGKDGVDLRPYLQVALRREILYYTTLGMVKGLSRAKRAVNTLLDHEWRNYNVGFNVLRLSRRKEETGLFALERAKTSLPIMESINSTGKSRAATLDHTGASLESPLIFSKSNTTAHATQRQQQRSSTLSCCCRGDKGLDAFTFLDFEPHLFHHIRAQCGINDEQYVQSLSRTRREKFHEGGNSGAFLYFSYDEQFIVKTLTADEADVLLSMLHDYTKYLASHPHTLITRFFGLHAIIMYGKTMYFAVMGNVLKTCGASLHERYDLKGSWVGRSRAPLEKGMRTDCRFCGQKFRVGGTKGEEDRCPSRPNHRHEANTVMKDNDLIYKLRLPPEVGQALGDQISADSEFLRRHGITDYSLLLGVHRTKYKLLSSHASLTDLSRMDRQLLRPLQRSATPSRPHSSSLHQQGDAFTSTWGIDVTVQDVLGSPTPPSASTAEYHSYDKARSVMTDEEDGGAGIFAELPEAVTDRRQISTSVDNLDDTSKRSPLLWARTSSASVGGDVPLNDVESSSGGTLFSGYRGGMRATVVEGPGIYYAGIIDILQRYTWAKWIERICKVFVLLQNPRGISVMPPDEYAGRFRRRVVEQLIDGYEFSELPWDEEFYARQLASVDGP